MFCQLILKRGWLALLAMLAIATTASLAADTLFLRDNLKRARTGDYIVTTQNKTYSLLHIYDKSGNILTIEEIAIPSSRVDSKNFSWKDWVLQGAPGQTSWVMYSIDLNNAQMKEYYSFTKNSWYDMPQNDNFLSTLLNLQLQRIPYEQRRKVGINILPGRNDKRSVWQPRMIVDGEAIDGVYFDAWKTSWPKDGSELSGKSIEVYVPEENEVYPSYFPYWLQISGMVGNAKIRIVDSGTDLVSPAPSLSSKKR